MIAFRKTTSPLLACAALAVCCLTSVASAQQGFLIRLSAQGRVEVVPYRATDSVGDKQTGIAVWNQEQGERWAVLPSKPDTVRGRAPDALAAALKASTRGGSTVGVPAGPGCTTFQPDQLLGLVVTRAVASSFLTPENKGHNLDGRITIRRVKSGELPAIEAQIFRGNQPIVKVSFAAGQDMLRWSEIPELPPMFKDGLPPGLYTLRVGQGQVTSFQVEDDEVREKVEQPLARVAELTNDNDPLRLVARATQLLDQVDEDGEPCSYTCDLLDDVDAALASGKSAWLTELRERLVRRLADEEAKPNDASETGLARIDKARAALQAGNWSAALETLDEVDADAPARERALALLYRAVIAAESGATSGDLPDQMFRDAITQLQGGDPADLYRAHNNYGGVLFARARDRVHNHAFQMASGVTAPLSTALADWSGALDQYQLALAQADKLPPSLGASVKVNLAQLYALLADMIRVLDYSPDGQREFAAGEDAATATARAFAADAAASKADALDPITRGSAHEVLAQLAYRADDADTSRSEATQARAAYLEAGSIAGVESIERLLGLLSARSGSDAALSPAQADEALQHLQLAHQLTEMLRQRIPSDKAGLSRAGFFARRAYVNERIVELLVAKGEAAQALTYAEAAKARALQDLLAQRGVTGPKDDSRDLAAVLESWPKDVAAVEYFLGVERGWVFLVDGTGQVHAQLIVDKDNRPIASRELVARVQQLLAEMESQATKMFREASSGGSFDHSWQNQLHDFYQQLLPPKVATELRAAKTVVIVPHHVLHYFPFAALVTEVDSQVRGKFEQPQPKFLIDDGFAICRAPSIAAWDLLRSRPEKVAQVHAVGIVDFADAAPLPGVEQDLANLKRNFGASVKKVVEAASASEVNVKDVLQQPGMLFIATHGRNIPQQPLASYLLCHGDDKNDGYLTAGELFESEIASQMIVMSACYSGLADQSPLPGDDLFGIERSLLNAGAGTIVSGLWDVYDATGPLLMNGFFTHLVEGQPAAAALVSTQRDFLRERRKEGPGDPWIHPYFWSVYTLSGSDRTSVEK